MHNITTILLDFEHLEHAKIGLSSLTDTCINLRDIEANGERNRCLCLLKSRGMAHSNQTREFIMTDYGLELLDVYSGPHGVLLGSARHAQEQRAAAQRLLRQQDIGRKRREIERKRQQMAAAIAALQATYESEREELEQVIAQEEAQIKEQDQNREHLAAIRRADETPKEGI